jgi:nucleotide-binding universal stress UspA family protein
VQRYSRVLAAVDFSRPARGAFEYALALSQRHGAELAVVQAVPLNEALHWHARKRSALTAKLRYRAGLVNVELLDLVEQGDPASVILSHAASLRPDVLILGTHQRTGIDRFANGSVAERVVAKSPVPVLVVPYRRRTVPVEPFSHLAVAVDFSAGSDRAVDQAMALVSNPADRITLLHVVPGFSSGVPAHLYRFGSVGDQDELLRDARRRLQLAVPVKRPTPAAIHARVLLGDTTTEISRVVESIAADLLVVGVAKRRAVPRAIFGTTAARLLRLSRVPVLAVPEVRPASVRQESAALQPAA